MVDKTINVIGVQEKKELCKIVSAEYDRLIGTMKQEIEFTQGEILEEAKGKFGLSIINQEIKNLEEKIKLLKDKKSDLGFNCNDDKFFTTFDHKSYTHSIDPKTKAGKFYYLKMSRKADIVGLEKEKDNRIKNIWLENDRANVKRIVQEIVKVPMIEYKKK